MSAGLLQSFFDAAKRLPGVRGIVAREQRKVMVRFLLFAFQQRHETIISKLRSGEYEEAKES